MSFDHPRGRSRSRIDRSNTINVSRQVMRSTDDRSCFTDEIAIDFPSVSAVVGRMVDAFIDEDRPAPFAARLQLSPREAVRGVTIPFDIPVHQTCRACGGRGEVWMDPCPACQSTGESVDQHRVWLSVPPGVTDASRFVFSITHGYAAPTRLEVTVAVR